MDKRSWLTCCSAAITALAMLGPVAARAEEPEAIAPAGAEIPSRFAIDDEDPERSVPSPAEAMKQPLEMGYFVMTLSERAEGAEQRDELGAAVKYYRALAKAVPDRAVGFARACKVYERMGAREQAVEQCRLAVGKDGAKASDHARLVRLMLARPGELRPAEVVDLDAMLVHLERELTKPAQDGEAAPAPALAHELRCELGARLQDAARLSSCAAALTSLAPDAPRTIAYRFAAALARPDLDEAERVLQHARSTGLPEPALASMQARLASEREQASLAARMLDRDLAWVLAPLCVVVTAGLLVLLSRRRRPRLSARREPA